MNRYQVKVNVRVFNEYTKEIVNNTLDIVMNATKDFHKAVRPIVSSLYDGNLISFEVAEYHLI